MIRGIGMDVVDVDRLAASLCRTPGLAPRLFTDRERVAPDGTTRGPASLAARFATKEAVLKAIGAPAGIGWRDIEVAQEPSGRPAVLVTGHAERLARGLGITGWLVSQTHDAGIAASMVIAEG
ncbi:holo-ACP synthase [Streptomyces sp. BI20]|uniref:holo-ACP synthase n=1 Tax=Streptomyces sp. BI20 TaxID=3403460 RepID=UPI003C78BDFC